MSPIGTFRSLSGGSWMGGQCTLKIVRQPDRKQHYVEGRGIPHLMSEISKTGIAHGCGGCFLRCLPFIVVGFRSKLARFFVKLLPLTNCQSNSTSDDFANRRFAQFLGCTLLGNFQYEEVFLALHKSEM